MDAERRARLGARWTCSECGTAFYDLGKLEAACPKCGAKQVPARQAPAKPKRAPKKKATGSLRRGSPRGMNEPEAMPEDIGVIEPVDDDDEGAAAEAELES